MDRYNTLSNKVSTNQYSDPITEIFEREELERSSVTTRPELDAKRRRQRGYFCTTCKKWLTGKNCRFQRFEHELLTGHIMNAGWQVAIA